MRKSALPPELYLEAHAFADRMLDVDAKDPRVLDTHWLPLHSDGWHGSDCISRLVAYVSTVPELHAVLGLPAEIAGAEWWLREQADFEHPKGLHTDKDVALAPDGTRSIAYPVCPPCTIPPMHPITGRPPMHPMHPVPPMHPDPKRPPPQVVSSVLYLGASGGATAVFGQTPSGALP